MDKFIAKNFVYRPIQLLRGEPVFKCLGVLERTQWWSSDRLRKLELHKMKSLISEAYAHVPFYRTKLENCKIKPDDLRCFEDWSALPILTKEDVQNYKHTLLSKRVRKWRLERKTTGGSTGQTVTLFKSPIAAAYARSAMYRGYRWWNVDIGEKQARFWGVPLNPRTRIMYQWIDFLMNRKRLSAFNINEAALYGFYETLLKFKPVYLYGYVSMLAEFARFLSDHRLDASVLRVRLIIATSEVLYQQDRALLEKTFQCKVLNEYGCGEVGPIAYECPLGSMHINAENVLVESFQNGELLITELNNFAMPLIRYRLGDCGRLSETLCGCGRGLPLLENIVGRAYDFIVATDGRRYHGEYIMYLFEELKIKEMGVKQFQVIQTEKDSITVKIVRARNFAMEACRYLDNSLKKTLGTGVKLDFEFVSEIEREKSGKMRLIKSLFSPETYNYKEGENRIWARQ